MQLNLKEFTVLLGRCKPDAAVRFDFCGLTPCKFDSYRGFYEQLALGWTDNGHCRADELLARAKEMDGAIVHGWKGGEFAIHGKTHLWVANRGEAGSTAIVGVKDLDWVVVIQTEFVDV